MFSMKELVRHPSRAYEDVSDEVAYRARKMARRPMATTGVVLLILGIIGFIWLFPELHRYMRLERM